MDLDTTLLESLCGQELAIDENWGFSQLNTFLSEMAMIKSGVPYSALGISERRAGSAPRILVPQTNSFGSERSKIAYGAFGEKRFKESLENDTDPGSIALLSINGVIRSEGALSTPSINKFLEDLHYAYSNPNITGIVVQVTSGGGESTASFRLREAIKERNKPVVGLLHYAASGGYLAVTGADELIASHESAQVGSIGAYLSINLKTLKKYSENFVHIYADKSPDKNLDIRKAAGNDFSGIQEMVNKVAIDFRQAVIKDRGLKGAETVIEKTLSGGMFSGVQAKRRGLVDLVGNLNVAVRRVNFYASRLK